MITDKQLADLLGVEVGEEFELAFKDGDVVICKVDNGLKELFAREWYDIEATIKDVFEALVIKLPWKPKKGEYYYFVSSETCNGVGRYDYYGDTTDKNIINRVTVYKTQEEVEQAVKQLGWEVE